MGSEIVSIIIPTYNQATRLEMTLQSLCHQREITAEEMEVIVVNDGSTDETAAILERFTGVLPLKSVHQTNQGRAVARNAGIRASCGSLLLFTDSDRLASNYWVKSHVEFQRKTHRAVGIGEIREFYFSHLDSRLPSLRAAMENNFASLSRLSRPFSYWEFLKKTLDVRGCCQIGAPWIMTLSGNLSVKGCVLDEVGFFEETLRDWGFEHFELGYRLFKAGTSFWQVTGATNYHLAHPRPTNFYDEKMSLSLKQVVAKFPDPALEALWPLLHGQLTLGEFDDIATNGRSCLPPEIRHTRFHAPLTQ